MTGWHDESILENVFVVLFELARFSICLQIWFLSAAFSRCQQNSLWSLFA